MIGYNLQLFEMIWMHCNKCIFCHKLCVFHYYTILSLFGTSEYIYIFTVIFVQEAKVRDLEEEAWLSLSS